MEYNPVYHSDVPPSTQFLNFQQFPSSSTIDHILDENEVDLSIDYSSSSVTSSFRSAVSTYPWTLLHNISSKNEQIVARDTTKAVRASVAFSIAPPPFFSTMCLGSSKENHYDAVLVFTFSNGDRVMYRINASTPLEIINVFNYNLTHRHIILTNNEIDTMPLYAHHLSIMNSFKIVSWKSAYNPSRLICGESSQDDGMIKKEIPIYHDCEYIAHLINHFIPKEDSIDPRSVNSPNSLYSYLLKMNDRLNT